jgi:hypothetical protein
MSRFGEPGYQLMHIDQPSPVGGTVFTARNDEYPHNAFPKTGGKEILSPGVQSNRVFLKRNVPLPKPVKI